ncbi:cupin domain-containing protein [Thermosulfurimonas sp. F29]|uniref:cupin domain-containing protein n=1 Tax=Thermosulfurimonas sp. F29 TaxID=2867247 RepID=UPI001C828168|nr:cupin domain-containing protein [Thermosulfurimonas sp. F29]MBX6423908.1 cupin domain-containing protein [Thermosulfurimonas sp. F29]
MSTEKVTIRKPTPEELEKLGVFSWPTWEKEVSEFDWYYPEDETFYVVEGEVEVELDDGTRVRFGKGDLVTFRKGVRCVWRVLKPIRKHYR